jgi:hypothetical protein
MGATCEHCHTLRTVDLGCALADIIANYLSLEGHAVPRVHCYATKGSVYGSSPRPVLAKEQKQCFQYP